MRLIPEVLCTFTFISAITGYMYGTTTERPVLKSDGACCRTPVRSFCSGSEVPAGKKQFYVEATNVMNWYQALQQCRSLGMDLATINNAEEQAEVARQIKAISVVGKYEFWISASDLATDGLIVWASSGKPLTYTNWGAGQPVTEKNCVEVMWNTQWRTWDCDYAMFYICEYYRMS